MTDFEQDGLMMAIQAFGRGDLDDARSMIESSPSMFAQNARAQNLLGSVYARQGDVEKAHSIWEGALMIDSPDPTNRANTWANMTGTFLARGEAEEAIKAANRALDTIPDHTAALHNRALAYQATKDYDKAARDLAIVTREHPDHADAWLAKGICELRLDDAKSARVSVERSLEINPMNPTSHAQLGTIYEALGDNLMANDSFRRALELAPGNEGLERAIARTA